MFRFEVRRFLYAGLFLCPFLLASTPDFAQETRRSMDPPLSIISLAPAPRPQGEMLARHPGDATFEHAPANYHVFAAASVDMDAGVEVLTLNFAAETRLNHIESKNKDFVIEPGGTCREGNSYTRGDACSLLVRFNPQGPGHRLGFINISHSDEPKSVLFGLVGNGSAPVVSFIPAVITTVPGTYTSNAGTIKTATNLAIDGGDILYIADTGNDHVKEIDSSGVIDSVTTEFGTPAAVAVDSLGTFYTTNTQSSTDYFAYYLPWGAATGFSNPAKPGSCTPSAPCPVSTVGMINPANVTIDGSDNLFFEEENKGAAEMPVSSLAGGDASFDLWYLNDQFAYTNPSPSAFAVDANDNLYTDYTDSAAGVCFLVEESVYAAETSPTANRVAGGSACGFSGDGAQARGAEISNNRSPSTLQAISISPTPAISASAASMPQPASSTPSPETAPRAIQAMAEEPQPRNSTIPPASPWIRAARSTSSARRQPTRSSVNSQRKVSFRSWLNWKTPPVPPASSEQ